MSRVALVPGAKAAPSNACLANEIYPSAPIGVPWQFDVPCHPCAAWTVDGKPLLLVQNTPHPDQFQPIAGGNFSAHLSVACEHAGQQEEEFPPSFLPDNVTGTLFLRKFRLQRHSEPHKNFRKVFITAARREKIAPQSTSSNCGNPLRIAARAGLIVGNGRPGSISAMGPESWSSTSEPPSRSVPSRKLSVSSSASLINTD